MILEKIEVTIDGQERSIEVPKSKTASILALSKAGLLTDAVLETLTAINGKSSFMEVTELPEGFTGVAIYGADGGIMIRDAESLKNLKRHLVIPKDALPTV